MSGVVFRTSESVRSGEGLARAAWLWGPAVLVMGAIYFASSLSDVTTLPGDVSDKTAHFFGYAVLAVTVLRATARGHLAGVTARTALLAWGVCVAYGASDEFHQRFVPGRTPALDDLAADALGAATAILVLWCVAILWRKSRAV